MAKTPRLDVYYRIICRLYEALYLLHILGKVRGPHLLANPNFSTILATRRRFLRNIAFLCDYKKGGPSTTSIAVEDRHDCNLFWVASNEEPPDSVLEFLRSVLEVVRGFPSLSEEQRSNVEQDLEVKSVIFATKRIKNQAQGLASSARRCREYVTTHLPDEKGELSADLALGSAAKSSRIALASWLKQFEYPSNTDLRAICQNAYRARKDTEMNTVLRLGREPVEGHGTIDSEVAMLFRKARHAIGRLAAYIRAIKELLEDGRRLESLLDVFQVAAVPRPACVPRLEADGHTTLDGVLKRMLRPVDARFPRLFAYLADLDAQTGLETAFLDHYSPNKYSPCVHSEVQMLHHFYDNGLLFFTSDLYIATSKPACFCCKLYFRHHPAGYEEPDSHEKVYPNWGPIFLAKGRHDPGWIGQRDVLNNVISDIRKEVLKEIERRRQLPFHPDTLTELTADSRSGIMDSDESSDSEDGGWADDHDDSHGDSGSESGSDSGSEGGVQV